VALIRAHYPTALEADLAWESLTEYFEPWDLRVGGCGFTRTGFAYLVEEENAEALKHNVALQQSIGVETDLVEPDELGEIDSALHPGGVVLAAYEPRGGYADPAATAVGFLRAAQQLGARFERRRVTALLEHRDRIQGVQTDGDPLEAEAVVVAAGAWSVPLTESLGLGLPIRPARVQLRSSSAPPSCRRISP
jgi:sarcosine oxidase, subunit beta